MKFDKLIKEVKGNLKKGDEITLPGSHETWIVGKDEDDYFEISNEQTGEITQLSKYKLADIKKVPILEFKTQDDKNKEVGRYKEKIAKIKKQMKGYKANSKKSDDYQALERDLSRITAALNLASRQTPYMTIY